MAESAYSDAARSKISRHIRIHKKEGMPQKQAVAAAMSEARREGKKVPKRRSAKKRGAKKSAKRSGGTKSQKKRAGAKGGRATARKSKK